MNKAEARLSEEEARIQLYLHPDIHGPLMKACQKVLISEHADLLQGEFQQLLDENRQDDLARMYNLLSRITDGLDPLRRKFATHVRSAGLAAVEKYAKEAGDVIVSTRWKIASNMETNSSIRIQRFTSTRYWRFTHTTTIWSTLLSRAKRSSFVVWIMHAGSMSIAIKSVNQLPRNLPNCSPNTPIPCCARLQRLLRRWIWSLSSKTL